MAGSDITRIVEGAHLIKTEWIVNDKFTASALHGIHFTADKGINFGNRTETNAGHHFKRDLKISLTKSIIVIDFLTDDIFEKLIVFCIL